MGILNKLFHKQPEVKRPEFPEDRGSEILSVTRTAEFIPHFIYSNKDNEIIGSIYLTELQAYDLNKLMRRKGVAEQDIAFLRK